MVLALLAVLVAGLFVERSAPTPTTARPAPTPGTTAAGCDGKTLEQVVWRSDTEIVRCLVDAGADVDARRVSDGEPLLNEAIWRGHTETVRILVDAGVDVNARMADGGSHLHEARWRRHTEIEQILLAAGATE